MRTLLVKVRFLAVLVPMILAGGLGRGRAESLPPSVVISSPAAGAIVSGTTPIVVQASDDAGIQFVSLSIDGRTVLASSAPAGAFIYHWDTRHFSNGPHTLAALAQDTDLNTATHSIDVTVSNSSGTPSDTTPPAVSISSPTSGAIVSGTVPVLAQASDDRAVTQVRFYVDGKFKSADFQAPYLFQWNTALATRGSHTITAQAFDAAGNTASDSIHLFVVRRR